MKPCRIWKGAINTSGYGVKSVDGRLYLVHRLVWEQAYGPIPEGMTIDHVRARGCTSRACIELAHLEVVTHTENCRRGAGSKLTLAQVAEIRESEETGRSLAARFGVHPLTISRVRCGHTWAEAA